ncbi:Crp/Fnr family transcriptional regulator [Neobacillus soli]|uniref:Crp/Fnr family transcriptional regulator n=1 Tax=Neobacillus soli TaxID=220688 RepID=UPI000826D81C|nr:Crp/Fnr family transcriptional regulator [Neobacillus soli]
MRYEWKPYLIYSNKKTLAKGDILFSQGNKSSGFYYLAKGKMSIQLLSEDGKERIIDYVIDGYLLGQEGITEKPYSTTAVCDSDVSLYYFSAETFTKICKEHPEANKIFMNILIYNIRSLVETIRMINKPFEQQMAYYFVQLYQKNNKSPFSISQNSLAKYIGTSRVTIYKIMQKWLNENIIVRKGHMIHILDLNNLKALYIRDNAELSL